MDNVDGFHWCYQTMIYRLWYSITPMIYQLLFYQHMLGTSYVSSVHTPTICRIIETRITLCDISTTTIIHLEETIVVVVVTITIPIWYVCAWLWSDKLLLEPYIQRSSLNRSLKMFDTSRTAPVTLSTVLKIQSSSLCLMFIFITLLFGYINNFLYFTKCFF